MIYTLSAKNFLDKRLLINCDDVSLHSNHVRWDLPLPIALRGITPSRTFISWGIL